MEPGQDNRIPSEAPRRLSKGLRDVDGPGTLREDLASLEGNTEALDFNSAGAMVILSSNAIRIERIPFSRYGEIRGYMQ